MTTAKQIIKDSYKILGIRFLEVIGNESAITTESVISQAFNKIGIFFLPVAGNESAATSEVIVSAALRKIQVKNSETPLTAQELADGNEVLNDLITQWLYDGIDLGVTSVPASGSSTLPTWSLSAVKSNLAVMLASEYERPITDSLSSDALSSLALLKERTEPTNQSIALGVVNNMLPEWLYDDIDLGVTSLSLGAASNLPDWAIGSVVSNLSVRLAAIYEKPLSESLVAQSTQSMMMLKERTSEGNLDNGLNFLNEMMAEWDQLNIRIGYLNPTTIDGDTGLPDYSIAAVKYNLALRIAPITEKPLTQSMVTSAQESYKNLIRQTVTDGIFTIYPDILPIGQGNKRCNVDNENYFVNPADNDLTTNIEVIGAS